MSDFYNDCLSSWTKTLEKKITKIILAWDWKSLSDYHSFLLGIYAKHGLSNANYKGINQLKNVKLFMAHSTKYLPKI